MLGEPVTKTQVGFSSILQCTGIIIKIPPSDIGLVDVFSLCMQQLLAVGCWFPRGTPVSSTRKLISSSSFHRLDMNLTVAEALSPNKPNLYAVKEVDLYCEAGPVPLKALLGNPKLI